MMRTTTAVLLSLIVVVSAVAQATVDKPLARQEATKPATPPPTIVQKVREAIAQSDFVKAEKLVLDDMAANGTTPIAVEAFSWLGRGAVAAKNYDAALTYAARTYEIVEEQLKTRKLDDEGRLPTALGAAIEVQALALAGQGRRSEAVLYLRRESDTYKNTSIVARLNKNLNLLSLEGETALAWTAAEWLGPKPPSAAEMKGKPVVLFLWAHWCGDCKKFAPILDAMVTKYRHTGLTIIAPTQRFGYVAQRKPAEPAEELAYIEQIRNEFYPWMKAVSAPVSNAVYDAYGVSTTPTLVFIDRNGKVSKYQPGQLTAEQIEPMIQKIVAPQAAASEP